MTLNSGLKQLEFRCAVMAGNVRYYPANTAAQVLLGLCGGKCFSADDMVLIESLGFVVLVDGVRRGV